MYEIERSLWFSLCSMRRESTKRTAKLASYLYRKQKHVLTLNDVSWKLQEKNTRKRTNTQKDSLLMLLRKKSRKIVEPMRGELNGKLIYFRFFFSFKYNRIEIHVTLYSYTITRRRKVIRPKLLSWPCTT